MVIEASYTVRSGLNITCHMLTGFYNSISQRNYAFDVITDL